MPSYLHPQWDDLDVASLLRLPTALLLIDPTNSVLSPDGAQAQSRLFERGIGADGTVATTRRLVGALRPAGAQLFWMRYEFFRDHYPATPMDAVQYAYQAGGLDWTAARKQWDSEIFADLDQARETEDFVITYQSFGNVFLGTPLVQMLSTLGIRTLLLCGYHLDECVEQAARTARDFGFMPLVVSDACLCTEVADERPALQRIAAHWAPVLTCTQVVSLIDG